jgi:hypothetical protein
MSTGTNQNPDRLYDLIPAVYRMRDAAQGYPLQGLLRVIAEQVSVVESDISGLYENWFIETCADWVIPYIGALVGYTPVASSPVTVTGARGQERERIMIPRREVANTIRFRRRKGTLNLLVDLAEAVADWPAVAVEFYRRLAVTQNINHLQMARGRAAELRDGDALLALNGPFDEMAHVVDVRRPNSIHSRGAANIPSVGVFIWRRRAYTITHSPAYCYEEASPNCFLFSPLGHDQPLFVNPNVAAAAAGADLAVPRPITRRGFERREIDEATGAQSSGVPFYYGPGVSLCLFTGSALAPVPATKIVPADLSDWSYRPLPDTYAVDPQLGRILLPPATGRRPPLWVSYSYGFSADMGGGEYDRTLSQPPEATFYRVGRGATYSRIADALTAWQQQAPADAVIEIVDSNVYAEPISLNLTKGQTLELRAANGARPVLRMLGWQTAAPDDLVISGDAGSWCVLDGLAITGRGVQVNSEISGVAIRHCTLVPGWGLDCDCSPTRPSEPSLEVIGSPQCVTIEHSIVGAIHVERNEVTADPLILRISDSIVDATDVERVALGTLGKLCAYAALTLERCTVFGQVQTHVIELASNSIVLGHVMVCRRQSGCMRFCYLPPGSRTPRRYECQPDLVELVIENEATSVGLTQSQRTALIAAARLRVEPKFNATRYGRPQYCQLSAACAIEITNGADDQSEMGVFHDLYQPQRTANLRQRLNEYTPAETDVGIIMVT